MFWHGNAQKRKMADIEESTYLTVNFKGCLLFVRVIEDLIVVILSVWWQKKRTNGRGLRNK